MTSSATCMAIASCLRASPASANACAAATSSAALAARNSSSCSRVRVPLPRWRLPSGCGRRCSSRWRASIPAASRSRSVSALPCSPISPRRSRQASMPCWMPATAPCTWPRPLAATALPASARRQRLMEMWKMPDFIKLNSSGMQCIGAFRAQPAGPAKGGIVVIQEIFGVNAHIRDVVERFAEAGYVAIAPAFFDHVESDVELDYDAAGIARGRALIGELDIDQIMADVGSAADSIRSAGKIGVVGYCWGGTIAMLAASRLGLPAVSYYGARNVAWLHETFSAPLQFHFGAKDA